MSVNNSAKTIHHNTIIVYHHQFQIEQENCRSCGNKIHLRSWRILILCQPWKIMVKPRKYLPVTVNNRNTRKRCEICSKLILKIPERRQRLSYIQFSCFSTNTVDEICFLCKKSFLHDLKNLSIFIRMPYRSRKIAALLVWIK